MSAEQEKFEADYLAAFPDSDKALMSYARDRGFLDGYIAVWQQQAARHAAEVAELVELMLRSLNAVSHSYVSLRCDLEAAIEKYEVAKP